MDSRTYMTWVKLMIFNLQGCWLIAKRSQPSERYSSPFTREASSSFGIAAIVLLCQQQTAQTYPCMTLDLSYGLRSQWLRRHHRLFSLTQLEKVVEQWRFILCCGYNFGEVQLEGPVRRMCNVLGPKGTNSIAVELASRILGRKGTFSIYRHLYDCL